jgi:hypothetical protein
MMLFDRVYHVINEWRTKSRAAENCGTAPSTIAANSVDVNAGIEPSLPPITCANDCLSIEHAFFKLTAKCKETTHEPYGGTTTWKHARHNAARTKTCSDETFFRRLTRCFALWHQHKTLAEQSKQERTGGNRSGRDVYGRSNRAAQHGEWRRQQRQADRRVLRR